MADDTAPPTKPRKAPPLRGAATPSGGHTACTPETIKAICDEVQKGTPLKHAAALAGISYDTAKNWRSWGEAGQEPYVAFFEAHTRAHARAVSDAVAGWKAGVLPSGLPDWKAKRDLAAVLDPSLAPNQTLTVKAQSEALDVLLDRLERHARPRLDASAWAIVVRALADDEDAGAVGGGERRDH